MERIDKISKKRIEVTLSLPVNVWKAFEKECNKDKMPPSSYITKFILDYINEEGDYSV